MTVADIRIAPSGFRKSWPRIPAKRSFTTTIWSSSAPIRVFSACSPSTWRRIEPRAAVAGSASISCKSWLVSVPSIALCRLPPRPEIYAGITLVSPETTIVVSPSSLDQLAAGDETNQHRHDRQHQQDVNESPQRVRAHHPEQPKKRQNNCNGPQHWYPPGSVTNRSDSRYFTDRAI